MNLSINTLLEKCCQKDKFIDESIYKFIATSYPSGI